jgi:hypothetical protein
MDSRSTKFQLAENSSFGGLFDEQRCREIASKVMNLYDGNKDGLIDNMEIGTMLQDCYKAMRKDFRPTATDIVQYTRVITRRQDSLKISREDVENVCMRLFLSNS